MLKKIMLSAAVLACAFMVAASEMPGKRPTLEFIKDGEIVESRQMRDEEWRAYHDIHRLEQKMDIHEAPLAALEKQIEDQAEQIERSVEAIIERALDGRSSTDYEHEKEDAVRSIKELTDKMRPALERIKLSAGELKTAALHFKTAVTSDYREGELDYIKVLDDSGKHNIFINRLDSELDIDVDIDLDFDF